MSSDNETAEAQAAAPGVPDEDEGGSGGSPELIAFAAILALLGAVALRHWRRATSATSPILGFGQDKSDDAK